MINNTEYFFVVKYSFDADKPVTDPFSTKEEAWQQMMTEVKKEFSDQEDEGINYLPPVLEENTEAMEARIITRNPVTRKIETDFMDFFVIEMPLSTIKPS